MLNFSDYPEFDTGERNGITDYLDYFKWSEIKHPVMTGKDMFTRQFIVIKMIINNTKIMQTLFERHENLYSNKWGRSGWMGCGHATQLLFDTCGGMNEKQYKFIEELLEMRSISSRTARNIEGTIAITVTSYSCKHSTIFLGLLFSFAPVTP